MGSVVTDVHGENSAVPYDLVPIGAIGNVVVNGRVCRVQQAISLFLTIRSGGICSEKVVGVVVRVNASAKVRIVGIRRSRIETHHDLWVLSSRRTWGGIKPI